MDYLDVVVHIFVPEVREFYGLERLWGKVPQLIPSVADGGILARLAPEAVTPRHLRRSAGAGG